MLYLYIKVNVQESRSFTLRYQKKKKNFQWKKVIRYIKFGLRAEKKNIRLHEIESIFSFKYAVYLSKLILTTVTRVENYHMIKSKQHELLR